MSVIAAYYYNEGRRIPEGCPVHRTLENHPVITTTLIRD